MSCMQLIQVSPLAHPYGSQNPARSNPWSQPGVTQMPNKNKNINWGGRVISHFYSGLDPFLGYLCFSGFDSAMGSWRKSRQLSELSLYPSHPSSFTPSQGPLWSNLLPPLSPPFLYVAQLRAFSDFFKYPKLLPGHGLCSCCSSLSDPHPALRPLSSLSHIPSFITLVTVLCFVLLVH